MTIIDTAPEQLTATQWQIAHKIAHDLVSSDTDVNDLGKAIAYLRSAIDRDSVKARTQFFRFLSMLVRSGNQIGHSGKTIGYYRNIDKACNTHLKGEEVNAQGMLKILGWAARLMRYYKVTPIGEIPQIETEQQKVVAVTERQTAIEKLKAAQVFEDGQIIKAEVEKKNPKGNKVTYLIAGVSFTEKETKAFDLIPESGTVKVQIKSLKEDGSINHVKFVEL